jgi:hypothetical protein
MAARSPGRTSRPCKYKKQVRSVLLPGSQDPSKSVLLQQTGHFSSHAAFFVGYKGPNTLLTSTAKSGVRCSAFEQCNLT